MDNTEEYRRKQVDRAYRQLNSLMGTSTDIDSLIYQAGIILIDLITSTLPDVDELFDKYHAISTIYQNNLKENPKRSTLDARQKG